VRKIVKLLLILIFPSLTQACLWLEGTTIDGNYKTFEDRRISSIFLEMSQYKTAQQNFQDKFYRESNQTIEYIALYQIMKGKYKQGINKLLEIEKKSPNIYSTASNLGTAYELQGNIPLAIKWIKEGIKRDAHSHGGTEWLHLLILEIKLRLENNSTLLKKGHIINMPTKFEDSTKIQIKDKRYTITDIRDALFYQLKERMIFVKPKDEIVADLLYTFAKIEEQTTVITESDKLLRMAIEYGFNHQNEIDSIIRNQISADRYFLVKIILMGEIVLILLIFLNRYLVKKKRA